MMEMIAATDNMDGEYCLFAVRGNEMAASFHNGENDPWLTSDGFNSREKIWQPLNESRIGDDAVTVWDDEQCEQP